MVKAQVHAGGRGKGGGIKLAKSPGEAKQVASEILGMTLRTPQTGPEGKIVHKVYVEEGSAIANELYLAITLDRAAEKLAIIASTEGGMAIEEVAEATPEKIITVHVDPNLGPPGPSRAARSDMASASRAEQIEQLGGVPRRAVPAVRREGRLARRDQPARGHRGAAIWSRSTASSTSTTTRSTAIPTSPRCTTPTRKTRASSRRRRSTSPTSASTATSAAW